MDNSLVQNRLTILGFTLTFLVFLVTFLGVVLGFDAQVEGKAVIPAFFWSYVNTFIPIVIGIMMCLVGVVSFLRAQWAGNRDWYDFGQVTLYLALSQALSGFNEVTARVTNATWEHSADHRIAASILILLLALASQALWLLLLWTPVTLLRARNPATPVPKKLWLACWTAIGAVVLAPGIGFYLRHPGDGKLDSFLCKIAVQFLRPLSWLLGV